MKVEEEATLLRSAGTRGGSSPGSHSRSGTSFGHGSTMPSVPRYSPPRDHRRTDWSALALDGVKGNPRSGRGQGHTDVSRSRSVPEEDLVLRDVLQVGYGLEVTAQRGQQHGQLLGLHRALSPAASFGFRLRFTF